MSWRYPTTDRTIPAQAQSGRPTQVYWRSSRTSDPLWEGPRHLLQPSKEVSLWHWGTAQDGARYSGIHWLDEIGGWPTLKFWEECRTRLTHSALTEGETRPIRGWRQGPERRPSIHQEGNHHLHRHLKGMIDIHEFSWLHHNEIFDALFRYSNINFQFDKFHYDEQNKFRRLVTNQFLFLYLILRSTEKNLPLSVTPCPDRLPEVSWIPKRKTSYQGSWQTWQVTLTSWRQGRCPTTPFLQSW